ncbi:hypothetical protein F2Q69_00004264 [Brassica cretica]|uniref:Uncharacterized protein n=1 Tax=Brassica cretica TaxID=69181 RepID=A0A8S9P402_BRACR|nr:hypothetical protein F2Q69_00004264 [Brassica cretica]
MSRTRLRLDSHECCSLSLELPSAAFEGIVTVKTETFFFSEFCLCLLIHCLRRIIQIKHCPTTDLKTIVLKYWGSLKKVEETDEPRGRSAIKKVGPTITGAANQNLGADHQIPVPEALINTIGQTHKFSVKVSDHNLIGKIQTITVTKILSPAVLPAGTTSVENHVALTSETAGDHASEGNKSICHSEEPKKAKRPKHDN